jgi:hypothetical protein
MIELLRRDLSRAPNLPIKTHMVRSLYTHYVSGQDWDGLRAALINDPDQAVGVYVASRMFEAIDPQHPGRRLASSTRYWDDVSAMLTAEPAREPLLVAALAAGLSAQGPSLDSAGGDPKAVFAAALRTLCAYVPQPSLAPAVPALAAALQRAGPSAAWREAARDLLIAYVGATPDRAKAVLAALAGAAGETLAVRAHCERCLALPAG